MTWHSLQTRLIVAFIAISAFAILLCTLLFIAFWKDRAGQRELDRVSAVTSAILGQYSAQYPEAKPASDFDIIRFIKGESQRYDVRVLAVGGAGEVVADSSGDLKGSLQGKELLPSKIPLQPILSPGGFISWKPDTGSPGSGLVWITQPRPQPPPKPGSLVPALVVGVPESDITNAWAELLPGILLASAGAFAVAAVVAVFVARSIARPLAQLTLATEQVAAGHYDVKVDLSRRDEVGKLGGAMKRMAVRVGESLEEQRALLENVSHDLKTPLTSILGFSQAMSSGALPPSEAPRAAQVIHEEASRLSERLDGILYLSELASGQVILRRELVAFDKLVRSVAARLEPVAASYGVAVELRIESCERCEVSGDRARLERALENIIDNACRYSPTASQVTVSTSVAAGQVSLEVTNPAPDLSGEGLARIFERFYRGDSARGKSGSGLGLAIARDIAQIHGGTLTATLAGGALTLHLTLPTTFSPN